MNTIMYSETSWGARARASLRRHLDPEASARSRVARFFTRASDRLMVMHKQGRAILVALVVAPTLALQATLSSCTAFSSSTAHGTCHRRTSGRMAASAAILTEDAATASRLVAEWCVASDRAQASVAISGATELASAMRDFWTSVHSFAREPGAIGRQRVLAFPKWADSFEATMFQRVMQHISDCSEVCEYLGESMLVAGRHPSSKPGDGEAIAPCPMIVLRSYNAPSLQDYEDVYDGPNPFAVLPDEAMDLSERGDGRVASDEEVIAVTRKWVEAVIVKMKVCPFSSSADRAGLPAGGVSYPLTHASTGEEVYEQFWEQVLQLAATDERELSTVLLLTPRFALHSAGGFDVFADSLNTALTQLRLEDQVQLVFFHPDYTFRDGKDRIGIDEGAANFARRSPYPMINLLRTPQVRKAQKGVPTGSVYTTNERNLEIVGSVQLQQMLKTRDWAGVFEHQYASHEENTWK